MQKIKKKYYLCFSWKLKDYLKENNLEYLFKARSLSTNKVFYLYLNNYKLGKYLKKYSKQKENLNTKIL